MENEITINAFGEEHVNAYNQTIEFSFKGETYSVELYWDTHDGYDLWFEADVHDVLEEAMDADTFDDLASILERLVMESK
jgi:hypothetical protein